jgi:Domain of unknown function (DUF4304)
MTYSVKEIFEEILKESLNPFLKKHGFKKRNLNFYQRRDDLVFVINFQKGKWNSHEAVDFFINCGIYSNVLAQTIGQKIFEFPPTHFCHFDRRIEAITGSNKCWFSILPETKIEVITGEVIEQLKLLVRYYGAIKTNDDFINLCIEENYLFNYDEMFKYLAINKDEKRIKIYRDRILSKLENDERLSYFETKINEIIV